MTRTIAGAALVALLSLGACAGESLRGTISEADQDNRTIVVNEQRFVVPDGVSVDWSDLDPGTQVLLSYKDTGGRKEITVIEPEADD